jgi:hypothetical protein
MSKPLTWAELNERLMTIQDLDTLLIMFFEEKNGRARYKWLMRIWSRYCVLRKVREKKEVGLL